jgi:hypothetical protein
MVDAGRFDNLHDLTFIHCRVKAANMCLAGSSGFAKPGVPGYWSATVRSMAGDRMGDRTGWPRR